MKGDCAVFYVDDKQVGGCFNWEMFMKQASTADGKWESYKILEKTAVTHKWWFSEEVQQILAKFYWFRNDDLIPAGEYEVKSVTNASGDIKLNQVNGTELVLVL